MSAVVVKPLRPFTPKEFSDVLGGLRTPDWVREQCHSGAIKTVGGAGKPPYLIPVSEAIRFCPLLGKFLITE